MGAHQSVAFTGGAAWHADLEKTAVGHNAATTFYQWSLSIRDPRGRVVYDSPKDGAPFARVEKAQGADLWFPVAQASMPGAARFMGGDAQQLVVVDREAAADCGSARVDVFFYDAAMQTIMPTLSVTNSCDLSAAIVHEKGGDALAVSGPYYSAKAALCCPTKNHVTAIFRFHNGRWSQTPRYFTVKQLP